MLTIECLHPALLKAIAGCGHGDKILITDGNYPLHSCTNEKTEEIYLALSADLPTVTDVLNVLVNTMNFEKAEVMTPDEEKEPEIYGEFRSLLKTEELSKLTRHEFYEASKQENVIVGINTGETRIYANILLTVGVR
ncbi:RbsD/FucU family protein [Niallia sp.]|uniref:RbsD/FucU family protein n=1 Tax=Niallia sp. TaxID=2837523 RepID=UPI00289F1DAF|nr:RbsD/FucU family protein [Niallia sp.]